MYLVCFRKFDCSGYYYLLHLKPICSILSLKLNIMCCMMYRSEQCCVGVLLTALSVSLPVSMSRAVNQGPLYGWKTCFHISVGENEQVVFSQHYQIKIIDWLSYVVAILK